MAYPLTLAIGDIHAPWVVYRTPLSYTQLRRYGKTTQGFGVIDSAGPRFIHLPNP